MVVFSDLPNEIVLIILSLVQPADLEHFAQVARRIHELAFSLLHKHREMVRKYRTLNECKNGGPSPLSSESPVIEVLRKVTMGNPLIGHYVRVVNLHSMRGAKSHQDEYTGEEVASIRVIAAEFKRILLPDEGFEDSLRLTHDLNLYRGELCSALLLPFLPNLEVLTIGLERNGPIPSWAETVIMNAPRAANPVLTKLRRIQISSWFGSRPCIEIFLPLATLPSLKELSIRRSHDHNNFKEDVNSSPTSEVSDLDLCDSIIDSGKLCCFLQSFRKLQTFRFSLTRGSLDFVFDPSLVQDTLLANNKTTLQKLTLLSPSKPPFFMSSLRGFEVLTKLHTQRVFLLPSMQAQLAAVLPRSLLYLWLNDSTLHDASAYKVVLQDTLHGKLSGTFHLESLTFVATDYGELSTAHLNLQQACREKGLNLAFSDGDGHEEEDYMDLLHGL